MLVIKVSFKSMPLSEETKINKEDFARLFNSGVGINIPNRPVDQFESTIEEALNSNGSFVPNTLYDLAQIGKGYKNGTIELIKDTSRTKIFVGAFHVNREDGTNKLTNVTIYFFRYAKRDGEDKARWYFIKKIIITNSSSEGYPVKKLSEYILKQLELDGGAIKEKYSKVLHGQTKQELQAYNELLSAAKGIEDSAEVIEVIRSLFENTDKIELTKHLVDSDLLPEDITASLEYRDRIKAVKEYIEILNKESTEYDWQTWFNENPWLLGSDIVRIVDERDIDVENIADYLVEAYDGFLDIVEIKKPSEDLKFWANQKDHENYYPHSDLVKAITQSQAYVLQVEKQIDSKSFQERVDNVPVIKPRCTLIFGRSYDWDDDKKEAYRILNSSYHNLTILTYDHVLERAKRMLGDGIDWPPIKKSS
jgi:hypothetical protein